MDFEPHSPGFQEAFSDLESGLGLTVGSFNFFVNKLGVQDLTDPRQLAISVPEATSVAAPSTADPSTASIPSSILQACSSATTMSTREMHELIEELQGEEAESAYRANDPELDLSLEDGFDCGISFNDFDEPETHIDNHVDSEICANNNLDFEIHNNLADAEMSIGDEGVDCEIRSDGPLDEHTGSDMSLDEDVESMTGLESTYTYPRVIPQQVYVAIAAETSDTAASRRPTEFPCTVTMPDGVTNLTITAEMATKADKVIKECTMMPAVAT